MIDGMTKRQALTVMATSVIVGSILLGGDHLLGMEELAIGSRADLVDHRRLEIDHDTARDMLARGGLREESVEGIAFLAGGRVRGHRAVRLDAMFQTVEF